MGHQDLVKPAGQGAFLEAEPTLARGFSMVEIRARALVSMTCEPRRRPLGPLTATVQLDA
jgi:hypothetical protein